METASLLALLSGACTLASLGGAVFTWHRTRLAVQTGAPKVEARVYAELGKLREAVAAELDDQRREWKRIAAECEEHLDAARAARARADGRRGGRPPAAPEPPAHGITDVNDYRRHLERGGPILPDVERALGL